MVDFSEIEKKDAKFLNVKIHVFTISKNLKHIYNDKVSWLLGAKYYNNHTLFFSAMSITNSKLLTHCVYGYTHVYRYNTAEISTEIKGKGLGT